MPSRHLLYYYCQCMPEQVISKHSVGTRAGQQVMPSCPAEIKPGPRKGELCGTTAKETNTADGTKMKQTRQEMAVSSLAAAG